MTVPAYQVEPGNPVGGITVPLFFKVAASNVPNPLPETTPRKTNDVELDTGEFGYQNFDGEGQRTYAIGLNTCACLIMTSNSANAKTGAALYHANAGVVPGAALNQLRQLLGNPSQSRVSVAYITAHAWDAGYEESAQSILDYGVPNVARMSSQTAVNFGIDSFGYLGIPG